MTITALRPTQASLESAYLKSLKMERLGRVVLLAGPNGGGKSRTLALIEGLAQSHNARMQSIASTIAIQQPVFPHVTLGESSPEISRQVEGLGPRQVWVADPGEDLIVVRVQPTATTFRGSDQMSLGEISALADSAKDSSIVDYADRAVAYFVDTLRVARNSRVSSPPKPDASHRQALGQSLANFIRQLVGVEISITDRDQLFIDGRPLTSQSLSPGQNILLQMSAVIHSRAGLDRSYVLAWDEPENHLHPHVLVQVVESLLNSPGTSQILMATHSVPLIAHATNIDPGCLYVARDGHVGPAGSDPTGVLTDLLGNDEGVRKLHQLTGVPEELASFRFAAQSLLDAGVAGHVHMDPQTGQAISGLDLKQGRTALLDFGAGKARLLEALDEKLGAQLAATVDYVAYDPSKTYANVRECLLDRVYGSSQGRSFQSIDAIKSAHGESHFDCVAMCNVLHEIPIESWLECLLQAASLLNPKGRLVILEDQEMSVGELPHPGGFLVLDEPDLKLMFRLTGYELAGMERKEERDGRLTAHWIPAELVSRVTQASVRNAVSSAHDRAAASIREVRNQAGPRTYKAAVAHARWTQQFVNSRLYLDQQAP